MRSQLAAVLEPRAKRGLILATVGSVVVGLLDSLGVVLILPLVNLASGQQSSSTAVDVAREVLGSPSDETLTLILAVAVVLVFVLKDAGSIAFSWWLTGFVFVERVRTSTRLLDHLLRVPYTSISSRSSAEMMRTMDTSVQQVFNFTVAGLMQTVSSGFTVAAVVVALVAVAPIPTVILIAYFGVAAVVFDRVVKPRALKSGVEASAASVLGYRSAFAALGAMKELKLRGTQQHFVDSYQTAQLRGARAGRVAVFISGLPRYLLEILFIVAIGIVIVLGSRQGGSAGGPVGLIALFVGAGFRLLPAVTSLLSSVSSIRVGADALRIVSQEISSAQVDPAPPGPGDDVATPVLTYEDSLAVVGVAFSYPGVDTEVLTDVSLTVPRGTSVALVGSSGAGKTTLVDLVVGLHEPTRGRIEVDGVDVATRKRAWQRQVAYVAQDVFLLEATLAQNVAFDQPDADIDRALVRAAVDNAQLGDLVDALPEGIDTEVGERGAKLSGGQRQRIGIARALYRKCTVLVLDEATAALDNETERRVTETVSRLSGQITVLVIAHRLSTVRQCDNVVFLSGGRVASQGTFDQVREGDPEFAELVALGSLDSPADPREGPKRSGAGAQAVGTTRSRRDEGTVT